ncbi:MAG: helix-turn-helix domain-containing protein [Clostridia bacterium]|nr:helix-turn-helix domain-containing protein [Clostridia bacterium]
MDRTPYTERTFTIGDIKISAVYSQKMFGNSYIHSHGHYEMFIFESGSGYISVADKKVKFSKNTAVIIPPYTDHDRFSKVGTTPNAMTIYFSFGKNSDYKSGKCEKLYKKFKNVMPVQNDIVVLKDKFFSKYFHNFDISQITDSELASAKITNMLQNLFIHIMCIKPSGGEDKSNLNLADDNSNAPLSNEVLLAKTIDDFMNLPGCTLSSLAEHINMSPRNTQRVLKNLYGMNFSKKMANIRLKKAIYLMNTTKLNVSQIAKICNYNQYAGFRKAFVSEFGVSPSEYRKHKNQQNIKNPTA